MPHSFEWGKSHKKQKAEGFGKRMFITLLRKAGFACHPFLGGKQFPEWNPQSELCLFEENSRFQGVPPEPVCLFLCLNKSKAPLST
jgi:hypothetical protein